MLQASLTSDSQHEPSLDGVSFNQARSSSISQQNHFRRGGHHHHFHFHKNTQEQKNPFFLEETLGPAIRAPRNPIYMIPPLNPRLLGIRPPVFINPGLAADKEYVSRVQNEKEEEYLYFEINTVDHSDCCFSEKIHFYMKMKSPKFKKDNEETLPQPIFIERTIRLGGFCTDALDESEQIEAHSEWVAFANSVWNRGEFPLKNSREDGDGSCILNGMAEPKRMDVKMNGKTKWSSIHISDAL